MPAAEKSVRVPKAERTAEEKQRMLEEKLARYANFTKMVAKRKKMSPTQKQKESEKRMATRKSLQGDLIFPVTRMRRTLRSRLSLTKNKKGSARVVNTQAAVFTTAVLEYLVAEVLELAGECALQMKKKRIVPRHIMAAIKRDDELATFIPKATVFSKAGSLPTAIPTFLLKSNVPRKDWNKDWVNVMQGQSIHGKGANDTASDINNNSKKAAH